MKKILIFLLPLLMLLSCGKVDYKPTVTGSTFDMLVVGEQKIWNDTAGKALNKLLSAPVPCLPELENNFKVIYVQPSTFDNVLRPARNIIFYEINGAKYTHGNITYEKDRWANTQAIARIVAPDEEEFLKVLDQKKQELLRFFTNAEETRALNFYSSYQNREAIEQVKSMFGVSLLIPAHLTKVKAGNNFMWISNGDIDMMENIFIYSYPYTSPDDFLASHILAVQDSLTKIYIPGPTEGSYMVHESRVEPVSEFIKVPTSDYCIEVRDLWRCEGDVMGGPAVSRSFLSPDHKQIITAGAFLYGPGHDKRNKLRMLEATLGSLRFPLPDSTSVAIDKK